MFTIDAVREALEADLLGERVGIAASFAGVTNDSRVSKPGELFVALKTEVRDGHDFIPEAVARGVAGVVVQREDILLPEGVWAFLVHNTKHAIGDLALHHRVSMPARAVAVAGNVGKTTTKELTAAVLARRYSVLKSPSNFNDEIGLAMTLFQLTEAHERAVVEVGMFELGEIRRLCEISRPHTAIVLNVGPTHLERLGSLEAIAAAKAEAVESLPSDGNAVLNADDPYVAAMASKTRARILTFGVKNHAAVRATDIRSRGLSGVDFTLTCGGRGFPAHSPLPGAALVYNALAAVGAAFVEGMSAEEAAHALSIAEVPVRLKAVAAINGSTVLDDSYNASPASVLAALGVLAEMPGRRLALLGDMLELGRAETEGHRQVGAAAAGIVDALFTVGPRGPMIAEAAKQAGAPFVRHFDSKEEAVSVLKQSLETGDVLLVKASHGLALGAVVQELLG
ncbi:MAG TPA: UDP-N-acetylmuramoyl-tripeptide--D-alanyl-D-alanine ligase [Dehalococcoidia bacterium]|nr:UDP-N-acetylmuramoyl-tripeptide--D-alanyl-D-alanine ligase [Dehalococcoidia bacterium]